MSDSSEAHQECELLLESLNSYNSTSEKVNLSVDFFQNKIQKDNIDCFVKNGLDKILPEIINIQQDIFQHNEEIMLVQDDTLEELEDYIKMSTDMATCVNAFLAVLVSKGKLDCESYYYIPTNINEYLCTIFYHCKESPKIYKQYFEKLQEFTGKLFQDAQLMQQTLLSCVMQQFLVKPSNKLQDDFLVHFLDSLNSTANIVFGLNTKLMANTWRCYSDIITEYGTDLTEIDINKPIMTLLQQATQTLKKGIQAGIPHIAALKICNFFLRAATTIIFIYWKRCIQAENATVIIGLLTEIYNTTSTCSGANAKLCDQYIHVQVDSVFSRFFIDSGLIINDLDYRRGVMIVAEDILQRSKIFNVDGSTSKFLKLFFGILNTEKDFEDVHNCNIILVNFASAILSVSKVEYHKIEDLFLDNLLQDLPSSIFACDLWLLTLSLAPPTLSLSTLDAIAGKYQTRASRDFHVGGGCCTLRVFLRCAFARLPDALKTKWIGAHEAEERLNLWALFGVGDALPRRAYLSQAIAKTVCRRGNPLDLDDLQFVIDGLDILSRLYTSKNDLTLEFQLKLSTLVTNLFSVDRDLLECALYCNFLANSLLPCIVKLIAIMCLDNKHLAQILNLLTRAGCATLQHKLIISVVIAAIAKTAPNEYNALTYSAIVKLLKFLLAPEEAATATETSSDGAYKIVHLYANTARTAFESNPEWMKTLANVAHSPPAEEMAIIAQPPPTPTPVEVPPVSENEPRAKRMKLLNARHVRSKFIAPLQPAEARPGDEVQDILDNMKDGVRRLQKLAANRKWVQVSRENSQDIHGVVTKLQQFLYRNT